MSTTRKPTTRTDRRLFRPYPAYKDTGIEWLGEIPAHWEVRRLKRLAHIASGFTPPSSFDSSTGQYPVYGSNGLIGYCNEHFVLQEVLAVGRVGASGSINMVPARSWVSDNALLLRDLCPAARLAWLYYVLQAMDIGAQAVKNAQPIITGTYLGTQIVPIPPEVEQKVIAAFLNSETAKIDVLVAKKARLIELLQQKRAAIISKTVTQGLDANAPMKDSGVEWLGEIPAHWRVKRLKYLARLNPESLGEDTDPDLGITYVDIGTVDSLGRIVKPESLTFSSAPTRARRIVRAGDVIISTVRTYLRAIATIQNPGPHVVVSTGFTVVRPGDDFITNYAAHALRTAYFIERVVANSTGVSFPATSEGEMATYGLAVPPESEQRAIAAFLDRETARIDELTAKIRTGIELLKEYRSALIAAAVTGRIDLRR